MKIKSAALVVLLISTVSIKLNAQTGFTDPVPSGQPEATTPIKKNIFKVNLTGMILKNYAAQYERVLSKSISVAVAYRKMPESSLPFKKQFQESLDETEQEAKDALDKLQVGNYAITPELRLYVSKKGYGRGFYFAPFYRYASFTANNISFEVDDNPLTQNSIALAGKLTSNTGGLMIGAQWALSKAIMLDWWIIGAQYGSASGNFSGVSARPLTTAEQAELRDNLEAIDIPFTNKSYTVTSGGANLSLDGPWGGLRGGICIGVRF